MDAEALFRDGVQALKERQDTATARKLLTQAVRLDPNHDLAWIWLARTLSDREKQLECLNRALVANPFNERAQALRDKLRAQQPIAPFVAPLEVTANGDFVIEGEAATEPPVKTMAVRLTPAETKAVDALLQEGADKLKAGDAEGAIEAFVRVLEIRVDHEAALGNAVRQLAKLGYNDDVEELLNRALEAGTRSTSIHLTAIDLLRRQGKYPEAEALMEQVVQLPKADDALALRIVDHFLKDGQSLRAVEVLEQALAKFPESQKLLVRMGEVQQDYQGNEDAARRYFEQAARLKSGTKEARLADKALENYIPILTDHERGSVGLAAREALGFGVVYLLMAWQDAGLNLLALGPVRSLGVILSMVGGYLVVTATSSPQQKPLAEWLGGKVPTLKIASAKDSQNHMGTAAQEATALPVIPGYLRAFLLAVGAFLLVGAFFMVFSSAIMLLRAPIDPFIPSIQEMMQEMLF